jgi:acetylglutamate synthase
MKQKCLICLILVNNYLKSYEYQDEMDKNQELITFEKFKSFKGIEKIKFKNLIKNSFNKTLTVDYFDYAKPKMIIIAKDKDDYLGTIVAEKVNRNIDYLDKIAVARIFQGKGLGKNMWELLGESSKKLVWRAKEENPINDFYKRQCDGMQKVGKWIIYWKGLNYNEIKIGINYAILKKETLGEIK